MPDDLSPFDPQDVAQKLCVVIRTLLGMPENSIRLAKQNAPTGVETAQFGTVYVSNVGKSGWDDVVLLAEDTDPPATTFTERVEGQRNLVALVQFYRGNAYSQAARLPAIFQSSKATQLLQTYNFGFVRAGEPKDITGIVATEQEPRAAIELEFHVVACEENELDTLTQFPFDLSVVP